MVSPTRLEDFGIAFFGFQILVIGLVVVAEHLLQQLPGRLETGAIGGPDGDADAIGLLLGQQFLQAVEVVLLDEIEQHQADLQRVLGVDGSRLHGIEDLLNGGIHRAIEVLRTDGVAVAGVAHGLA